MKKRISTTLVLLALALQAQAQATKGYTMFWLTETITGTTAGPFVNKPGNRVRASGREWTILAAQPGKILFTDTAAQDLYGPYDLVLQRIIDLGDVAFSFSRIEPFRGDDPSADIASRTSPAPRIRRPTIVRPERWEPDELPGTNPAEHAKRPSAFSLEKLIRPPTAVLWYEPFREIKYDWSVGDYSGSRGAKTETTRYGISGAWRNFFFEGGMVSDAETAGSLVPNGAFLSDLCLSSGSGYMLRGGYCHSFVIDGGWNGNLGGCLSCEKTEYDMRASTFIRRDTGEATADAEASDTEAAGETGIQYTHEHFEESVEMEEFALTFLGGIDYTSQYWGVGLYFTLDLYTDTSFSGSVAVRDETFDLSADRTHPIAVMIAGWYSPFADYRVGASASTGAETLIRLGFGKFF
ncbi:MAG: hypothetical protein ACOX9C_04790 [Kiritimatiellia bacterium]|jgi:hypothetical protein|uniref:hypothetical protein n=1 Tax=Atribacter sp. TaxID=2847780 RepID=UPI003D983025